MRWVTTALVGLLLATVLSAHASEPKQMPTRGVMETNFRWHDRLHDPLDCNSNGIDDAADAEQGTLDDINHNGVADPCDPDTALISLVERRWRIFAVRSDTVYLGVLYKHMAQVIEINYTVPIGSHRVRLVVTDRASGTPMVLESGTKLTGAYVFPWEPSFAGRSIDRGSADIALVVDHNPTYKRVAWDWTRQFR